MSFIRWCFNSNSWMALFFFFFSIVASWQMLLSSWRCCLVFSRWLRMWVNYYYWSSWSRSPSCWRLEYFLKKSMLSCCSCCVRFSLRLCNWYTTGSFIFYSLHIRKHDIVLQIMVIFIRVSINSRASSWAPRCARISLCLNRDLPRNWKIVDFSGRELSCYSGQTCKWTDFQSRQRKCLWMCFDPGTDQEVFYWLRAESRQEVGSSPCVRIYYYLGCSSLYLLIIKSICLPSICLFMMPIP